MTTPTAEEIVRRLTERYATCASYADRGRYECIHNPDGPPPGRRYRILHFETRFRRPDHFFFEFVEEAPGPRESWKRYVIRQAGGECRAWWSVRGDMGRDDLRMAIAGATGVSRGTASTIPGLLLPDVLGPRDIADANACERLDDVEIDGRPHWCLRPRPSTTRPEPDRYAIDPDTLLIRRVEGRTEITPEHSLEMLEHARTRMPPEQFAALEARTRARTETQVSTDTTDYHGAFDVELDDAAFAFEPE